MRFVKALDSGNSLSVACESLFSADSGLPTVALRVEAINPQNAIIPTENMPQELSQASKELLEALKASGLSARNPLQADAKNHIEAEDPALLYFVYPNSSKSLATIETEMRRFIEGLGFKASLAERATPQKQENAIVLRL